jgi:hypothetical protein
VSYILSKEFKNHFGLDLKSSDINRADEFSSGILNAQYAKNGDIEKRRGYKGAASSNGGYGLFVYNRTNPTTGLLEPELLTVSNKVSKLSESTLTVTYVGADPTALISIYFDSDDEEYKCEITEGTSVVLTSSLGIGFDEASIKTVDTLRSEIDALANFTATVSGVNTMPAAFLDLVRNHSLVTSGALAVKARSWSDVNTPVANPLSGSETNKNLTDFENVTSAELNNLIFFSNGYDYLLKYDGQNLYRAGLPQGGSPGDSAGGAGALTGTYTHKTQYVQIDAVGNVNEGNIGNASNSVSPVAQSINISIDNIVASSGFNTNCAIVAGAQVAVNTITVDDGSGGSHTMKVGDKAYFYDSISPGYVTRNITAITATTITIDGAAVTVADNAVISNDLRIAVYRNKNGGTLYYLVAEIPNNSFTAIQTYNDNITDANLGAQFITPLSDRSLPPKGKYVASFNGQLVISGQIESPNEIFWSDIDSPEYFPAFGTNQALVENDIGDKITGIKQNNESFAIFKNKSIHILTGDLSNSNIRIDVLTKDIGCAAHATIQEVRGNLYFLSDQGVYSLTSGQLPQELSSNVEPLFKPIVSTDAEVLVLKRAIALNHRDNEQYICFIPAETTTYSERHPNSNSILVVEDYYRNAWLKWDNINMQGGSTIFNDLMYFVERRASSFNSSVDHILYKEMNSNDSWDYQDNSVAIDWEYDTNWYSFSEPSVFKKAIRLKAYSLNDTNNNDFTCDVLSEFNYVKDVTKHDFSLDFSNGGEGYGLESYGDSPYGSPVEPNTKHKLNGKFRSIRFKYMNSEAQQNVKLSGWELEIASPYKLAIKE